MFGNLRGQEFVLQIVDQKGRLVFSKDLAEGEITIDLGDQIPAGVYFVILKNQDISIQPKRLVIE